MKLLSFALLESYFYIAQILLRSYFFYVNERNDKAFWNFSIFNRQLIRIIRFFYLRILFLTDPYSWNWDSLLPPFSLFVRFSRPHEKRNEASHFFRTSVINYERNLGQEEDDVEADREKKGGKEEDEEVRLAGGPTAVNRDGSNGQTSRVPETPTYFR